jgi:hypothetical protein
LPKIRNKIFLLGDIRVNCLHSFDGFGAYLECVVELMNYDDIRNGLVKLMDGPADVNEHCREKFRQVIDGSKTYSTTP